MHAWHFITAIVRLTRRLLLIATGSEGASKRPSRLPYRAVSSHSLCFTFFLCNLQIRMIQPMVMISLSEISYFAVSNFEKRSACLCVAVTSVWSTSPCMENVDRGDGRVGRNCIVSNRVLVRTAGLERRAGKILHQL